MKLSNLKNALGGLARTDVTPLVISPSLTLYVRRMHVGNQDYAKLQADFGRENPDHPFCLKPREFITNLVGLDLPEGSDSFLANIVVAGWLLLDDEGKEQPFSVAESVDLFNISEKNTGRELMIRVVTHATADANYHAEWESAVAKNS